MMPRPAPAGGKIRPGVLAIRDAGPFRSSIRRKSFDEPGLVIEVEKLDLDRLCYEPFCELRPEDIGEFIESLSRLRHAAREASANLTKSIS